MAVIAQWQCPSCGGVTFDEPGAHDFCLYCGQGKMERSEYVPAEQLRGAVEDREWLRGIVYEFLLTGPRKRTGLSDVEMQRFLSIHVGGQS